MIMSTSNELQNPAGSVGTKTFYIQANLTSSDSKTSPYIDTSVMESSTLTHNIVENENNLYGYTLQLNGYDGNVNIGDVVWQNNGLSNTSAIVLLIYNGTIRVSNASMYVLFPDAFAPVKSELFPFGFILKTFSLNVPQL